MLGKVKLMVKVNTIYIQYIIVLLLALIIMMMMESSLSLSVPLTM